jgi:hypothetical protein
MIVPRYLDLDWLHSATELLLSGRYRHRREGKTVAYLMLMVGEAEVGGPQNNYLYIGETAVFTTQVATEFAKIIKDIIPTAFVRGEHNRVRVNEQLFCFYPIDQLITSPQTVRTLSIDRIFMDIDDRTQRRLDKAGTLDTLFHQLLPQLSYRRGDVI